MKTCNLKKWRTRTLLRHVQKRDELKKGRVKSSCSTYTPVVLLLLQNPLISHELGQKLNGGSILYGRFQDRNWTEALSCMADFRTEIERRLYPVWRISSMKWVVWKPLWYVITAWRHWLEAIVQTCFSLKLFVWFIDLGASIEMTKSETSDRSCIYVLGVRGHVFMC